MCTFNFLRNSLNSSLDNTASCGSLEKALPLPVLILLWAAELNMFTTEIKQVNASKSSLNNQQPKLHLYYYSQNKPKNNRTW